MMLSAAMMVKNEAAHLERCLKSLCGFIPNLQIIVLDTGSTDNTVEIAQKYTTHVYHQKWQDNFALHRTKSFSYAKGDWIMQIDADEEIKFENGMRHENLIEFLSKLPPEINAVGLPLKDWRESESRYAAEFDVVRIFRKGKMRWRRRIHNEAIYEGEAAYCPIAHLKHWGYDLNATQKKAKAERTIRLLKLSMEEDPTDYESLFYLAQASCAWADDDDSALEYANKYIDFKALLGVKFNPSIYHLVIGIYIKRQDYENAMRWIKMGLEHNPHNIDVCYDLMQLGLKQANSNNIAIGAQKFVVAMERFAKDRLKSSGQFFFTNNSTCYTLALYYLTLAMLEKTTIEQSKLYHMLPKCSQKVQDEISKNLTEFSRQLGWQFNKKDNEKRIITPDDIRGNQIVQPAGIAAAQSGFITGAN